MQRIYFRNSNTICFVSFDSNSFIRAIHLTNDKNQLLLTTYFRSTKELKKFWSYFDKKLKHNFASRDFDILKNVHAIQFQFSEKSLRNQKNIEDILIFCKDLSKYKDDIQRIIEYLPYRADIRLVKQDFDNIIRQKQNLSANTNNIESKLNLINKLKYIADLKNTNKGFDGVSDSAAKIIANEFYSLYCKKCNVEKESFIIEALKYSSLSNDFDLCKKIIKNEILKDFVDDKGVIIKSKTNMTLKIIGLIDSLAILSKYEPKLVLNSIKKLRETLANPDLKNINKFKL